MTALPLGGWHPQRSSFARAQQTCVVCSTVGTSFCTSPVSLRRNQLWVSQWVFPSTLVAFETQCLSHPCLTPFKYFKWVHCGAITWLLDKHQVIHQAGDGHTALGYTFASWLQKSCEDSWPSTKPSRTRGKQQIVNTINHCNAPHAFKKWMNLEHDGNSSPKRSKYEPGSGHDWENVSRGHDKYTVMSRLQRSPHKHKAHQVYSTQWERQPEVHHKHDEK